MKSVLKSYSLLVLCIPIITNSISILVPNSAFAQNATHEVVNTRQSEVQVLNAEKWASLAWLDGTPYPAKELTEDWKMVLMNQFPRFATNSGIREAQQSYDAVHISTNKITRSSLQTVVDSIDTQGEGIPVVVFNPLAWGWVDTVRIRTQVPYKDGYHFRLIRPRTSGEINLPIHVVWDKQTGSVEMDATLVSGVGIGYSVYRLVLEPDNVGYPVSGDWIPPKQRAVELSSTLHLRGRFIDLAVDKSTGCITSLKTLFLWSGISRGVAGSGAKIAPLPPDEELIAPGGCGNQFQAFRDAPKSWNAWNINSKVPGQSLTVPTKADSVELLDAGSDEPAVRVTRTWQSSKLVQIIRLGWQARQVEIDTDIDWHEKGVQLKAVFPLAVTSDRATYEIPYGTIERPLKVNNWDTAQPELPAMRWADLSGTGTDDHVYGLSVLSEPRYGYDIAGNLLQITLLRPPVWPNAASQSHFHFRYALYPHLGTWKDADTMRRGWEFNYPLTAMATSSHPGSLSDNLSLVWVSPDRDKKDTVVVTSVKKAENGDALIIRLYEWAGNESKLYLSVPPGMNGARVANLAEEPVGDWLPIDDMRMHSTIIPVSIHPYEILTLRVEYPSREAKR